MSTMNYARYILALGLAITTGCASGVQEIDLHDSNVPLDARKFVADAQDAVSIARARRDDAAIQLRFMQDWRTDLLNGQNWPKGAESTVAELRKFTGARVKMAELNFNKAAAQLELAEAKYTLSTAETAMRNDLAVYDLTPLRAETDEIRDRIEGIAGQIEDQRIELDKRTQAWWKTYAGFMKSKETPAFYISPELLAELKETQAQRDAARAKAAKENPKEAKKAEKEEPAEADESETISEEDKIDLDL